MSDASHELPPQPNHVSAYVVEHVRRSKELIFEELNGDSPKSRDDNFIRILKAALKKSKIGRQIGFGGSFDVHPLEDAENVVVKRLKTEEYKPKEIFSAWETFQGEHAIAQKYFGRRFIPYTVFIDDGHYMVQERAQGERYKSFRETPLVSSQMKVEMIEFIRRYEHMMREEGAVLEHFDRELMIDYDHAKITVLDTNGFMSLKDIRNDIAIKTFLKNFEINADSIRTATDIHQALLTVFSKIYEPDDPLLLSLQQQDYSTLMQNLDMRTDGLGTKVYRDVHSDSGFANLMLIARHFAPEGQHPQDIQNLMQKFGIIDTDLIPTQEA